ncbi:aldo/keto reductase [Kumtagia ephedrae]|uniref:Aldo/keto reductase n=1 Tax=Kumtagia ephedrae TaxID=2116701 RepID=A0A2P7SH52_9HYPH|nr:aldo/keto reductase [Mesorhizobium ephedrae]PSJ61800.1 aldo/keto reductase [Mesorhizobium ephedrae]
MHVVNANGAAIPALGLGTWTLRGDACADLVASALALGYRHVDTAARYDNEADVGRGLAASDIGRDAVFVTTKVWYTDIAAGKLERAAEASLRRLGLHHVDLLLIHWPNPTIPLKETIGALNAARRGGLTRHVGVSNFPPRLLAEAVALSEAPLVCDQVEYHPYLDQSKLVAACRAADMALVSYCPLFRDGGLFSEPAVRAAAEHHGKTPGQVILRWHVQQAGVVAIPRTTRKERLAENIAVFDFALSEPEMEAITTLTQAGRRLCDHDEFPIDWAAG